MVAPSFLRCCGRRSVATAAGLLVLLAPLGSCGVGGPGSATFAAADTAAGTALATAPTRAASPGAPESTTGPARYTTSVIPSPSTSVGSTPDPTDATDPPDPTGSANPTNPANTASPTTGSAVPPGVSPDSVDGSTPSAPIESAPLLTVAATALGMTLVDADGAALYLNGADAAGRGGCGEGCLTTEWTPVTGAVAAGFGVDATLISVVDRADGTKQVSYAGWPLYRLGGEGPGTVRGHRASGTWFALNGAGTIYG